MQKSKILIPLLSIGGIGTIITPVVALTLCSCSQPKTETFELAWDETCSGHKSSNIEKDLTTDVQYIANFATTDAQESLPSLFRICDPTSEIISSVTSFSNFLFYQFVDNKYVQKELAGLDISTTQCSASWDTELSYNTKYQIRFKLKDKISFSASSPLCLLVS